MCFTPNDYSEKAVATPFKIVKETDGHFKYVIIVLRPYIIFKMINLIQIQMLYLLIAFSMFFNYFHGLY